MTLSLIFDMDGTLFQTDKILEISLENTFNNLRESKLWDRETPIELYRKIMGVPLPEVWENLLPNCSMEVRELANEFFHEQLIANIKDGKGALYPHVEEVFSYLKNNNYSIYIASNGQIEYLKAIVDYYYLNQWITETFSIQQVESDDKADLVSTIIKKYDIQEGAVIGDRLSDINAAKKNGLTAIGCRFDFSQEAELYQAELVIDDLQELKRVFT